MHHDEIALGDAGAVRYTIAPAGITLDELTTAPGWQVAIRQPTGRFGRPARKPAEALIVVLRQGLQEHAWEWELEVARLDDGWWEHALRQRWSQEPEIPIETPAGAVRLRDQDGVLSLVSADPGAGWTVRSESPLHDEVIVVFTRGTEEWEVLVLADHTGYDPPVVEREHRWRVAPQTL